MTSVNPAPQFAIRQMAGPAAPTFTQAALIEDPALWVTGVGERFAEREQAFGITKDTPRPEQESADRAFSMAMMDAGVMPKIEFFQRDGAFFVTNGTYVEPAGPNDIADIERAGTVQPNGQVTFTHEVPQQRHQVVAAQLVARMQARGDFGRGVEMEMDR